MRTVEISHHEGHEEYEDFLDTDAVLSLSKDFTDSHGFAQILDANLSIMSPEDQICRHLDKSRELIRQFQRVISHEPHSKQTMKNAACSGQAYDIPRSKTCKEEQGSCRIFRAF